MNTRQILLLWAALLGASAIGLIWLLVYLL
jgi:hypothetical protein